jgi:hypothetical protein
MSGIRRAVANGPSKQNKSAFFPFKVMNLLLDGPEMVFYLYLYGEDTPLQSMWQDDFSMLNFEGHCLRSMLCRSKMECISLVVKLTEH